MEAIHNIITGATGILNQIDVLIYAFLGLILKAIGTASLIVKITPTLKDDDSMKKVIQFIGKFIALDKYGPNGEVK